MGSTRVVDPDLGFIREIKKAGGDTLKKCYQCATCSVVCNLSPADKPFPRKEMLMAQWGQSKALAADPDVWMCHQCNDCTTYCPRGARPGDVLAAIRTYVYKHYAFPRFMGSALASPKALPWLLLTPIIIMIACIALTAPTGPDGSFLFMTSDVIDFNYFLPHSSVDALFVFGNILIFIFAAIGFLRFWKDLKSDGASAQMGFVPALIKTVTEILSHARFKDCEANRPRATAHLLLLFGFIGAMITTGLVLVFVFLPHYAHLLGFESINSFFTVPIDLPHPVKILGAVSGLGITIGAIMLVARRAGNKDQVGANGYADYLFLYIILIVGVSGMLSWLLRLTGIGMLAYGMYFIHMVTVYFLLWYMPYSKFAHMIYRTLALTHARQIGRLPRTVTGDDRVTVVPAAEPQSATG